eukprot:TRINITY_DN18955_c0_g1_i1.p1 TRINITY_DN18955_c0_g1~~TRINITY_DN18955_c0_g1_i1.p1  ORF type:complete len:634 (+),score=89.77 TRINITY_DN18955_c0_g1_i1:59-1903(+)
MEINDRPESEKVSMLKKVITRPSIPDSEAAHLGPVDKFVKYGRVPCKLVLNILMVILLTLEVAIFVPVDNHYHNDSVLALSDLFTPNGQIGATPTMDYHFYDSTEIVLFLNRTFSTWNTINESATGLYLYELDGNGARILPYMELEMKKNGTFTDIIGEDHPDVSTRTVHCTLTPENPIGPFAPLLNGNPIVTLGEDKKGVLNKNRRVTKRDTTSTQKSMITDVDAGQQDPFCEGDPLIFEKINSIIVHLVIDNIRLAGTTNHPTIRRWTMQQAYSMTSRSGVVEFEMTYETGIVGRHIDVADAMSQMYTILPFFCLIIALWDLVLRVKQARSELSRKQKARKIKETIAKSREEASPRTEISIADNDLMKPLVDGDGIPSDVESSSDSHSSEMSRARDFDVEQEVAENISNYSEEWWDMEDNRVQWLVTAVLTDTLIIVSRILILYINLSTSSIENSTLVARSAISGLAILFAWVVIISHLEHQPRFYLLMKTLRRGTPRALKFVSGCFPILMGYAILGTVMFGGYSDRFATLDGSFVVLFSVMNGDIIDETFESIFLESSLFLKIFSRVYLYTFIALFIYAILNILLAIMEDAYFQVKRQLIVGLREEVLQAE